MREVKRERVTYQLWRNSFSLGNEEYGHMNYPNFHTPFFLQIYISLLNQHKYKSKVLCCCGLLPSSHFSPLSFLLPYLPTKPEFSCPSLSHSSVGGSTHRPLSFISWIRASVAFSIAIPRFTTVWSNSTSH